MDIVVCIKQAPIAAEAKFDPATKRLVRDGVRLSISSIDRRALLEALRLRGQTGGTVTALTMGPPQAKTALLEVLAFGADRAVHLTDPAFAGSDTLATSRALSAAIRKLKPDLVMCGKFTVDSETSQVPSEIAEMLDFPQVTGARVIKTTDDPKTLKIERETDEGHEDYLLTVPGLISVTELVISGRLPPTPEELAVAGQKPLLTWGLADIGLTAADVGEKGSPTRVAELRSAQLERAGRVINTDPEAAAKQVVEFMLEKGLFDPRQTGTKTSGPRRHVPTNPNPAKAVWVVAETAQGQLRGVSLEMLGKAQTLATRMGGEVAAVLIGGPNVSRFAPELAVYGADRIYIAEAPSLAAYETAAYTEVLTAAIRTHKPAIVLMPSTTNGRDWAPRVAARLGVGLTGDCVDLDIDPNGDFAQIKPAFGGNIVAPIYTTTVPAMATVRPGMLMASEADRAVKPRIVPLDTNHGKARVRVLEVVEEPGLAVTKLDNAQVVVGIGKGIGDPKNIPVVAELAQALDGSLAASLLVTSAKWVAPQLQLGLTGRALARASTSASVCPAKPTTCSASAGPRTSSPSITTRKRLSSRAWTSASSAIGRP